MKNSDISIVIKLLKKEYGRFQEPIVTKISRKRDPFTVLISTVISARTKDNVTAAASRQLYDRADTPAGIAALPVSRIAKLIYPAGFYKTKAKNIKNLCRTLLDEYDGKVPDNMESLLSLPGVGRKTANLVLSLAFDIDAICVDTHVHRISNRLGYVSTKTPEQTEFALRAKLPRRYWIIYNDLLVTYGQNVCRPVGPHCETCRIREYCDYGRKGARLKK